MQEVDYSRLSKGSRASHSAGGPPAAANTTGTTDPFHRNSTDIDVPLEERGPLPGDFTGSCLEAAIEYASRGWPVLPVRGIREPGRCTCPLGSECSHPGKHPWLDGGYKAGVTDAATIRGWWRKWPLANVGLVTGRPSRLYVLDVDPRHGGNESLARLELPATLTAITGGGGRHFYFQGEGLELSSCVGILPGLDLKAEGGYAVAPPSRHASGKLYAWAEGPQRCEIAPFPQALLELIRPRPTHESALMMGEAGETVPILEGTRNRSLFRMACQCRRLGFAFPEVLALLAAANKTRCEPPLGDIEVEEIACSSCRYLPSDPIPGVIEGKAGDEKGPKPRLIVVTAEALLSMQLPPREYLLGPWLRAKDLAMVYAPRGGSKTWACLGMACSIAGGGKFLNWNAAKQRRVLYVDGELPKEMLEERIKTLLSACDLDTQGNLRIFTPDLQEWGTPNIAASEGQRMIEEHLDGVELLVLDNLSCLCRGGDENDAQSWEVAQDWLLRLRRQGLSVVFAHHTGKAGTQRGTSKREDILDFCIALKRPKDYEPEDGARFEVHFEKARGLWGGAVEPIEAWLKRGTSGTSVWETSSLKSALADRIVELYEQGLSVTAIAKEVDRDKSNVSRALAKAKGVGLVK